MAINANITPVPVYAFRVSTNVAPETYTLISGQEGKHIILTSCSFKSANSPISLQDSAGLQITLSPCNSFSLNGAITLGLGADLQAVVTGNTAVEATFIGFIQ
jgi:hypothetical protein